MAITTGVFNTTLNPPEANARSFAAQMIRRFPNGSAPLFGLASMIGKSRAKSASHGYFSKTMSFIAVAVTAAAAAADAAIMLPSAGMTPNMVLHNPRTRENILVQSITSGGEIQARRGFGRKPAAAILAGDRLIQIGTAFAENSNRPQARRMATVYVPNFTQIFRDAWALSDTARASYTESGLYDHVTEDKADCAKMHSLSAETSIIWGQAIMDTSGPQPIHATQGIVDAIEQYAPGNANVAGATTNYQQLVALVEPAFEYSADVGNPTERLVFCDNTAMATVHEIGRQYGQINLVQTETNFGMKFMSFTTHRGTLHLKTHPVLNGLEQEGVAIVLDPLALKLAYLDGRDTKREEYGTNGKIVENGTDGVGGSLTTEFAVELVNPNACAFIENLVAAG